MVRLCEYSYFQAFKVPWLKGKPISSCPRNTTGKDRIIGGAGLLIFSVGWLIR